MKFVTFCLATLLLSVLVNAESYYEISYDTSSEISQVVKYLVHKDELPYCHQLTLSCHFIDFHEDSYGFHRRRDHTSCNQKNMANFSSMSYKEDAYDYSWDYTGELHATIMWRQAVIQFACFEKGQPKPIQTSEQTIVKSLSEPTSASLYRDEDDVGFTVQVADLDWEYIQVQCSSQKVKFETEFYCYPDGVTETNGTYEVRCGSYLLYGIGDYYCTYRTWAFGESSEVKSDAEMADLQEIKQPKPVEILDVEIIDQSRNVSSEVTVIVSTRLLSNSFQTHLYINCSGDEDTDENITYNQHVFDITNLVYQPLNLALYKPTDQSSSLGFTHTSHFAVNGIDDDPDDFSMTAADSVSWWRVDLQQLYEIGTVRIYNSNDYREKLAKIVIQTSVNQTLFSDVDWTEQYRQKVAVGKQVIVADFEQVVQARMVELRSENGAALCLNEVTIHEPVNLQFKWSFRGNTDSFYTLTATAISKPYYLAEVRAEDEDTEAEESVSTFYNFYA